MAYPKWNDYSGDYLDPRYSPLDTGLYDQTPVTSVGSALGIRHDHNAAELLKNYHNALNSQSRAPLAPRASLGSNPLDSSGYVPYTAEGGLGEGSFQSGSGAAKPWEASDKELMLGMMASNMFPTRDQPRIMGDSGGSGGGMAKGAIQGAMIGSKFGSPWWGAAIGGGLGALGMFDTTTPPKIVPAEIKRGQRTAFPQVPPMASYYPGLLNA